LGGKFDESYDIFRNIKNTNSFDKGVDIYDQNVFVNPKISKKPKISIDVGMDHKENLLERASSLKFYNKLIKADASKKTPFKDNEFDTVFSNIIYWLNGDIEKIINELVRISNDKIIIGVPNLNFKKSLIYNNYLKNKNNVWAKFLDRGIYSNVTKHCYSNSKWEKIFEKSNLKIENHFEYISENLVKTWA
jgi:ubiquinone/menaquinone biosynthesis C-methylase UbiE